MDHAGLRFPDEYHGSIGRCDGGSHLRRSRHHHAGLVRRAGSLVFGPGRPRIQHAEVPQLLHADHIRLRHGEFLRLQHIRINDVGRAEAIDYRNFQYRPQEAENKYYLTRWAELYFSRNRFTIERDQTNALYFLNSDVQRAVIEQERKDNIILTYRSDSTLPYIDVEVKSVILDDLRQSPYSARIEFEKVYTNPSDHTELKRERWTASVTYVFRANVKNNELAINPLGLTIVRFRADQAFD
jgi:hypothetical protein